MDESETVDNLIESVLYEFDIDEDTAREDVEGFTSELI
ncbi:PqqD family peptide modification chaperone [Intestinibacter sp.]